LSGGASLLHRGNWAIGHLVWKWQPVGGEIGLGTSPASLMRCRFTFGSGIGTADNSASV
jgi:hypothetical protein